MTTTPRLKNNAVALLASGSLLLAGCNTIEAGGQPIPGGTNSPTATTPTVTTSPTPTPSITQSLSADQKAALAGLTRADAVSTKLGRNPAAFTKSSATKLAKTAFMQPLLKVIVGGVLNEKAAGVREQGERRVLSLRVGRIEDLGAGGKRVVITRCIDQRDVLVVSAKTGKPEAKRSYPEWLTQEAALRKAKGSDRWLAAGVNATSTKKCGSAK